MAKAPVLTPQAEDFPRWYQDVVAKAELAENGPVRGTMVIRQYATALWELMTAQVDKRIKAAGAENVYFPLFIPESYLRREAEHVEGFSPELAVVTHAGGKELEEPLVVRPTSETVIGEYMAKWIQSYRDLPLLLNQWANVVRWELRPRLFLRTTEFLWQEGHTAHADAAEAQAETEKMLEQYRQFMEEQLCLALITGEKPPHERFPGAVATYSLEAMMQDGKALQAGTSHYLGTGFAKAANIQFQDKDGQLQFVHTTSWGVSTRLMGAMIMTHGDDDGMRLPPAVAPSQVVIVPILREDADAATVLPFCEAAAAKLRQARFQGEPVRVKVDARDKKSQDKRWEWIKKGAPLVVEVGPRDVEKGELCWITRLDIKKKNFEPVDAFAAKVEEHLNSVQSGLKAQADAMLKANIRRDIKDAASLREHFKPKAEWLGKGPKVPAYVRAYWCGEEESLKALEDLGVTVRNRPFDQPGQPGTCVLTGKPAEHEYIFARAY
jgi:prolyl-tRNA synthetase